ncbi:MAG TPA: zinc-ribbon domain-containing protein [Saprospiraceae bacterium]|nr:zinc-ribbon domain-containing protein [Saprospiraceae bacterium]
MFCTKCGKVLDDSLKFCTACGTPVKINSLIANEFSPQIQEKSITNDDQLRKDIEAEIRSRAEEEIKLKIESELKRKKEEEANLRLELESRKIAYEESIRKLAEEESKKREFEQEEQRSREKSIKLKQEYENRKLALEEYSKEQERVREFDSEDNKLRYSQSNQEHALETPKAQDQTPLDFNRNNLKESQFPKMTKLIIVILLLIIFIGGGFMIYNNNGLSKKSSKVVVSNSYYVCYGLQKSPGKSHILLSSLISSNPYNSEVGASNAFIKEKKIRFPKDYYLFDCKCDKYSNHDSAFINYQKLIIDSQTKNYELTFLNFTY